MNQKGFANIVLIILVIVLAGALGYVTLVKKSVPVEQPQSNNLQNTQTTAPPPTNNAVSQNPSPTSSDQKIIACYQENVIPNNSIQRVVETSRRFVNIPKDLYPKEINSYFKTVSGNATAGWISNGGLPGEGLDATPECWSTYYEFDGNGEVDLRVKGAKNGVPDYFVRFIVGPTR